jgi:hypothetical protein
MRGPDAAAVISAQKQNALGAVAPPPSAAPSVSVAAADGTGTTHQTSTATDGTTTGG